MSSRLLRHQSLLSAAVGFIQKRFSSQYLSGNSNVLKLNQRGIFQNVFPSEKSPDLWKSLISQPQCVYCGFDPTADSLHVGHLVTIMALLHCQRAGHQVIAVIGGATGHIGDPTGKTKDRDKMNATAINHNVDSLRFSLETILHHHHQYFLKDSTKEIIAPKILNNADWYKDINVVDFLSNAARHFRLGTMLRKQSVQSRLNSPEGMSFTEFCYQVFQAYDWLHLKKQYDCSIQIGGNDQLGNIVAGHDLIQRVCQENVFGLTVPLITSSTGDKLSKTAGNAVWLNPDKTSAFELYQFFFKVQDSEVENYLKLFTLFSDEVIQDIVGNHEKQPEQRVAQRKLAEQVTLLVHGTSGLESARRCTDALYHSSGEKLAVLSARELRELFSNVPTTELYLDAGSTVLDMVLRAGCFGRAVDAERVIKGGGVTINHQRALVPDHVLVAGQHILPNSISLIRIGKKKYYLVKWLGTGLT